MKQAGLRLRAFATARLIVVVSTAILIAVLSTVTALMRSSGRWRPSVSSASSSSPIRSKSQTDIAQNSLAVPFTFPNLVIYRVGDGSAALSGNATPVFLDEYTMAGGLVQSIPMPTAVNGSNRRLTASGTGTSEGLMTLSKDGRYLTATGY